MCVNLSGVQIPPELTAVKSIRMNEAKMIINPRTKEIEEHAPDTVVIQTTYLNNFWVVPTGRMVIMMNNVLPTLRKTG